MPDLFGFEHRLQKIESRNHRVELDKAWETSWIRRLLIVVLTSRPQLSPLLKICG